MDAEAQKPSKKQMRKQLKKEAVAQRKEQRRQEHAAYSAEQKRKREAEWESLTEEQREQKRQHRAQAREERTAAKDEWMKKWRAAYSQGPRVVVDMDFDDKMLDHEVKSVCQQVMYCWSIIRQSEQPIQLSLCGLPPEGRLRTTLMAKQGIEQWQMPISSTPFYESESDRLNAVYLTADSDNVISSLDPGKVYIIGGIVDHNRHKGLTLQRAKAHGCDHGKLPLADFLDLEENHGRFNKVLTVNHMVGVLTKYHETKDWAAAFVHAIPSRKKVSCSKSEAHAKDEVSIQEASDVDSDLDAVIEAKQGEDERENPESAECDFEGVKAV